MNQTLQRSFLTPLSSAPKRNAVAFLEEDELRWLSYEQFYGRVSRKMIALTKAGIKSHDVCLIILPSDLHCAETIIAVLLLGKKPLLVAPPFLQNDNSVLNRSLSHVVEKTATPFIITPHSATQLTESLKTQHSELTIYPLPPESTIGPNLEPPQFDIEKLTSQFESVSTEDYVGLQLTSGTTNLPKICFWKQSHVMAALINMGIAMNLGQDDVLCNWTPFYHDMGLVNNLFLCLSHGVPMVIQEPHQFIRRPASWLQLLTKSESTVTWSPNFGFALVAERATDSDLEGVNLEHVRGFYNAAERIHVESYERFFARFEAYGVRRDSLKTNFGCAEVVGGVTFTEPDREYRAELIDGEKLFGEGIAEVVPPETPHSLKIAGCGIPAPGVTIQILDEQHQPLEEGRVGHIAIKTPSHFDGYLGNEEATARALKEDTVVMGDMGYLRDGELFWVGRTDERITVMGKKYDPSDFEFILNGVAGLRPGCFAAFSLDSSSAAEAGVVLLCEVREADADRKKEIGGAIRREVTQQLGIPLKDLLLVPAGTLTKTSSGKRRHLFFKHRYQQEGRTAFENLNAD